jgi:hypothetical protein
MAAGHRLRVDCRVIGHCWAFFSGKYDDEKWSALLSFLRPGGAALDVGANIGFHTIPEIAPELTGHGLPLSKCEAYNRVYDQFYRSR